MFHIFNQGKSDEFLKRAGDPLLGNRPPTENCQVKSGCYKAGKG